MKNILFFLSFTFIKIAFSNISPSGFEAFMNEYFVETGSYKGEGIRYAQRAGFKEIHSLEISPKFANYCKKKFMKYDSVHVWQADSGKDLWDVIKDIQAPITFWLDGHNGAPDPYGGSNSPILLELEQIKQHPIKTHTILIDDMHVMGTILFDYLTKERLIEKILEINPNYQISYIVGGGSAEYPNNIMVAKVKDSE